MNVCLSIMITMMISPLLFCADESSAVPYAVFADEKGTVIVFSSESLPSVDICITNGQAAYQRKDYDRAYAWYMLADGSKFISPESRERLKEGCLRVAMDCGAEKRTLTIPLLEKVLSLGCSDEMTGEVAGGLSELYEDPKKKELLLTISAEAGSVKGMNNLGTLYRKSDIQKAIDLHKKVAESGALPGMMQLLVDIALEPKHGIATETLCQYANKLVEVFNAAADNKEYVVNAKDQEKYVLTGFKEKSPEDYEVALEMIEKYASIRMVSAVASAK